jgi:hypothetical protein
MCLATFLLLNTFLHAQFVRVGNGFSNVIRTLYSDSLTHGLIAGGDYVWEMKDSTVVSGIARWNGVKWDSLATRIVPNHGTVVAGIEQFYRYKGDLYCYGLFSEGTTMIDIDPTYPSTIGRLDTIANKWDPMPCILSGSGIIRAGYEIDDTAYVTGVADTVCGAAPSMIYKWDGSSFYRSGLSDNLMMYSSNVVHGIIEFQGTLYMWGGIYNPADASFKLFMKWDGSNWVDVPGITGEMVIKKAMVYNNELYIGGYFFEADGTPGNCITKFDGTTWSNLGGGVVHSLTDPTWGYPVVNDFTFYHGDLYVVGGFTYAGGVPAQNIAKWDGTDWCGLGSAIGNKINAIGVWNDSIYIGGGFMFIDGDTMNYVAKWAGGNYVDTCGHLSSTGIAENSLENSLFIYPNPTHSQLSIELNTPRSSGSSLIEIKNILGQTVYSSRENLSAGRQKMEIDVSELPAGLYFIHLNSGNRTNTAKFIRQ